MPRRRGWDKPTYECGRSQTRPPTRARAAAPDAERPARAVAAQHVMPPPGQEAKARAPARRVLGPAGPPPERCSKEERYACSASGARATQQRTSRTRQRCRLGLPPARRRPQLAAPALRAWGWGLSHCLRQTPICVPRAGRDGQPQRMEAGVERRNPTTTAKPSRAGRGKAPAASAPPFRRHPQPPAEPAPTALRRGRAEKGPRGTHRPHGRRDPAPARGTPPQHCCRWGSAHGAQQPQPQPPESEVAAPQPLRAAGACGGALAAFVASGRGCVAGAAGADDMSRGVASKRRAQMPCAAPDRDARAPHRTEHKNRGPEARSAEEGGGTSPRTPPMAEGLSTRPAAT